MTQSNAFTLVKPDHRFNIDPAIAKCPYCNQSLSASVTAWTLEEDGWVAEHLEVECDAEPELGSDEWNEYVDNHFYMPYVYWLPITTTIENFINRNFRFNLDER